MREIGGYFEFEQNHGKMLHDDCTKLNSGRSCLGYIIKARNIKKIALPVFLCDCIEDICIKNNVEVRFYRIDYSFKILDFKLNDGEWLYIVNYYGQLSDEYMRHLKEKYDRIIIDNAQAYFQEPIHGVDTLYTCRKFFGVTDGGILSSTASIEITDQDESYDRISFIMGRYEKTGKDFFRDSQRNEERFYEASIKRMSSITENILHGIDYDFIEQRRRFNFEYIHSRLGEINRLTVSVPKGPFMYPLCIEEGFKLRKKLIDNRVYVPVLWPNVLESCEVGSVEACLTNDIVPIPIDQRYRIQEMQFVCDLIKEYTG